MSHSQRHLFIAGGGTGGHVFPGLAVAAELARRGWQVSWIGRPAGMEHDLVGSRGVAYHGIAARPLLGRGAAARLAALATLGRSALTARRLLRREEARAVLGTGGYVSAPAVVGARLAGRPAILLEPNAVPGSANRLLSRLARAAAVAWPETGAALACPIRVTGVPVGEEFSRLSDVDPAARRRVLVLGGSQGARQINELVPAAVAALAGRGVDLRILHQCGRSHLETTRRRWAELGLAGVEVEVVAFLDDVAAALSGADLVISRAGAITLAEICAAGRPALLIPYGHAGGHQADNAARLAAAGGGVVLAAQQANPDGCAAALAELLADVDGLRSMGRAARRLARPRAAAAIADLIEEAAA